MANTRRSNKKQTRLSFTPLPSSSPARANQPVAVRDRAAAVTLTDESQPSKQRKTLRDYLPSPSASSERPSQLISDDTPSVSRVTRSFMTGQNRPQHNVTSANNPSLTQLHSLGVFDDSESDTPNMFSSPTKRSRGRKAQYIPDEDDSTSEEAELEDQSPRPSKRQAKKKSPSRRNSPHSNPSIEAQVSHKEGSDDEEDEDDLPSRPSRRKTRPSSAAANVAASEQDKADIDEDLEFLGEIDTESPRAVRQVSKKKNAKQQALDALKQRRLKRSMHNSDAKTNDQASSPDDEDEEEEDYPDNCAALDEIEDEDFIVDVDGDETLGAPVELPFEFSHYRSMKPKQLFKFVVEWMVQKKINPAFSMEDEVYRISFDRLDDTVRGLGGSKFTSSAWTPAFSKALKSRPVLKSQELGDRGLLRGRCDACNRSGHPATWEVSFQGKTYDKNSLEEDSDDESGGDGDGSSSSGDPDGGETFYIGRFCMGNASVAHTLAHWRFHLNEWVIDHLQSIGELEPESIVRRDKWSTSKRRKDAERIVDSMESEGEIRRLYSDFKTQVSDAHLANDKSGFERSSP